MPLDKPQLLLSLNEIEINYDKNNKMMRRIKYQLVIVIIILYYICRTHNKTLKMDQVITSR